MKPDLTPIDPERLGLDPRIRDGLARPMQENTAQLQAMLTKLVHRDNFDCAEIVLPFTHGVETLIDNPLKGVPRFFEPKEAWNASTGAPMSVLGTPRFNRTPRRDRKLGITVEYDLRHTEPYARYRKSANQPTATASSVPITWDVTASSRGSAISVVSSSRVTVAEAGSYLFRADLVFLASALGTFRVAYFAKNGSTAAAGDRTGLQQLQLSAINPRGNASTELKLSAGDYVELFTQQDTGGNLDVIGNAVVETSLEVSRLYNDSTPTGMVRGVLWGG